MTSLASTANLLKTNYWPLIKSRQTLLLSLTGAAGYLCQPRMSLNFYTFLGMVGSLLLTISGCTVLNMVLDRDIDRKMQRTRQRPLATGQVNPGAAAALGAGMIAIGLLWTLALQPLFFGVVFTGAALNVIVYTLWLKRRTAWSILAGGIAGGMPILAGRALAAGRLDGLGMLLALVVICWIPSHNLTFSTLYADDYRRAGVPIYPIVYGLAAARFMMAFSSLLVAFLVMLSGSLLGLSIFPMLLLFATSFGLVFLGILSWLRPSVNGIQRLYKYSSLYMLACMLLLSVVGLWG